jgi:hypothetical protein
MQKMNMLFSLLEDNVEDGGAGLSKLIEITIIYYYFSEIRSLVQSGVISKFYPLHDPEELKWLVHNWTSPKKMFSFQPLDRIRDYFGEEVAMYFGWLGFYTTILWIASLPGTAVFVIR